MIIAFVIALIVVVLVFGGASVMQSYASAQQAQATIETAKAAQMATTGTVLVIVLLSLILLAIIALVVYSVRIRSANRESSFIGGNYAGIFKESLPAAASALPKPKEQDSDHFTVEHLTRDQLDELTNDLLNFIED